MKTIKEVMNKHRDNWGSTFSSDWNDDAVYNAIVEYTKEVVSEILENIDEYYEPGCGIYKGKPLQDNIEKLIG